MPIPTTAPTRCHGGPSARPRHSAWFTSLFGAMNPFPAVERSRVAMARSDAWSHPGHPIRAVPRTCSRISLTVSPRPDRRPRPRAHHERGDRRNAAPTPPPGRQRTSSAPCGITRTALGCQKDTLDRYRGQSTRVPPPFGGYRRTAIPQQPTAIGRPAAQPTDSLSPTTQAVPKVLSGAFPTRLCVAVAVDQSNRFWRSLTFFPFRLDRTYISY